MTCSECHAAKVRCEQVDEDAPCSRCARNHLECRPHISRQGQGPKKRKSKKQKTPDRSVAATATQPTLVVHTGADGLAPSEDGCILRQIAVPINEAFSSSSSNTGCNKEVSKTTISTIGANVTNANDSQPETSIKESGGGEGEAAAVAPRNNDCMIISADKNHFGLQYLIRSWFAFAFKRRSLSLLSRAALLGSRVGLSMDDLLCESESQRGMDFLYPILLLPRDEQSVSAKRPLEWSDIPQRLLRGTHCFDSSNTAGFADREQRWIWIREMKHGKSQYLISQAFGRDICPLDAMKQTWTENKHAVIDLFLVGEADKRKHTQGFASQLSRWPTQHPKNHLQSESIPAPTCTRISRMHIHRRDNNNNTTDPKLQERTVALVDQLSCLEIVNLDHAFYFIEYVLVDNNNDVKNKAEPLTYSAEVDGEQDLAELGQWLSDDGMDSFMDLLEENNP